MYKIHSARFRKADWDLKLTIKEAFKNKEIVTLADSTMLRFINEINGVTDADEKDKAIRKEIKRLKRQPATDEVKSKIKNLYDELYKIQYKQDYLCLVIDKIKDYEYAYRNGLSLNGKKYKRLLGTNGGIKNSTIVFISEDIYDEIYKRVNNGRNLDKPLVPAKFESYQALTCSGSIPVSDPDGMIVVEDCVTHFKSDIIQLDDENSDEPKYDYIKDADVELIDSDGYGLILPYQSEKWTAELQQDGISSGFCIRNSWCKGMLFTFDFIAFADKVAKNHTIKDAWGTERDITKASIIVTTSMLKLWDSYNSMEHYLACCKENHYTFSVTKCCPEVLENERHLNYQFLQSYSLTDAEIDELIAPTVNEIKEVLGEDWRKSILYLKGMNLDETNIKYVENDVGKALMINPEVINDPFARSMIHRMIKKAINEAKFGVLKVHANFSIVSGDCYSLCQNMFGLPVTGLLKAGESYNKYWVDCGAEKVACFRAPMSCHNNIRILKMTRNDEIDYWYKYMTTVTVFNSWDTTAHALNGCDKDSDTVFLTDNPVLLSNTRELPAIMCVQRKAEKIVITQDSLYYANINGFGDEIGSTTNRITDMFDVQSNFSLDSEEYKTLTYRIMCGQLYQQNAIDRTKGIIAKPMPQYWYNNDCNKIKDGDSPEECNRKEFNHRIAASMKPYFMCYIYSKTMNAYKKYVKGVNRKALMEYNQSLTSLLQKDNLTKAEKVLIDDYYNRMPVGMGNSLINKICWRVEDVFKNVKTNVFDKKKQFDYNIYKSDVECDSSVVSKLTELYKAYNKELQEYTVYAKLEHINSDEMVWKYNLLKERFKKDCDIICPNDKVLCNTLLDICYVKENTKQFVWDICGETIIENLLNRFNGVINYATQDDNGDIEYRGKKFIMKEYKKEEELWK